MKTITKVLVGAASAAALLAVAGSGDKKQNNTKPAGKRFLFIGDSLTFGYGTNGITYVDKLKEKYPHLFIKKIAITGKQTGWMLQQLQNELLKGEKYDVITIWGGVNDIYARNRITEAKQNLQQMFDLAKQNGAEVATFTAIPTRTYKASNATTTKLTNELNAWLRANRSVNYLIDVNQIVNDGNGGTKAAFLQNDKLHLTASGQTEILNAYISKLGSNQGLSGLGFVSSKNNRVKLKALALELELDLLQLKNQKGIELKYNKSIKASVAEAIKQLIAHSSLFKGQSPMAIQVLYNSFKDVPGEIYDPEDGPEKIIDVSDYKSLQYALLTQLSKKSDFVHTYYNDDRFTLTEKGQRVVDAISARAETLKAKKRGSDLFPDLMGPKRIK